MRESDPVSRVVASSRQGRWQRRSSGNGVSSKRDWSFTRLQRLALIALLMLPALGFGLLQTTGAKSGRWSRAVPQSQANNVYTPTNVPITRFERLNLAEAARQESLAPAEAGPSEIRAIDPPKGEPPPHGGRGFYHPEKAQQQLPLAPPLSPTGASPGPTKTFKGEFLSSTSIPPDTMGAVGDNHVVNVTNDRMRIQTRDGVELSRVTLTSFWAGVTIKGAAVTAFDPKVMYDRFNDRYILCSTFNAQSVNSGFGFAVTQTNDPTGLWNRFAVTADPTSTAAGGIWIDYPSMGFNMNWIVLNYNAFGFGTSGGGYLRSDIYAIDKQAAYANTLGLVSTFTALTSTCTVPFETKLGCGFTMAPALVEDNTTPQMYFAEDWDSAFGQLRLSKLTGTAAAPILTVGIQITQSPNSWRFNASRISQGATQTGGYLPQRQQSAHLTSGTRIMANDSRMQNCVLRNGTLWCAHTVMLAATPTAAGVAVGGAANPDIRSGVQWWQIDQSIEPLVLVDPITGLGGTPPIQRGRIEDPTANNCHNGSAGTSVVVTCDTTGEQVGEFFVFPNISVNQNNDVLIGYTKFSNLTYPSGGYSMRLAADPVNTMRDQVIFRPGQANYNIGAGTGAARQNRWGDYSASQTDPLNDIDFWTVQEYAGTVRDFGIGLAGNWETWWALVKPSTAPPSLAGNLIISEFRLRGPQGVRDEFVELYNPGNTPIVVTTADNTAGWALAYSTTAGVVSAVAVIPNGTVIPARGHFLIANNPDGANGPTVVYSLNTYPGATNPGTSVRGADSDTGYSLADLADNGGFAIFKTSTVANFSVATRMDSVGFASTPVGLFKEGTGIPDVSAAALQQTFYRNLSSGLPKDTEDNASDFVFADTAGTLTTAGQRLGAPGPENLDGPIHNTTGTMAVSSLDGSVGDAAAPNFIYDPTPVANGAAGTITVRRRFINLTGSSLTRMRLRVVDGTIFPQAPGLADLRLLSSPTLTVETPPTQTLGGGLDSSGSVAAITFATPLANGAATPVDLVFGVQQAGCFSFVVISETLPVGTNTVFGFRGTAGGGPCAPTAAPARISGSVVTPDGEPVSGVTMRLSGAKSAIAITDSEGNYHFDKVDTEQFYTVTPARVNYRFTPDNRSFSLSANKADAVFTAVPEAVIAGSAIDTPEYFVRQHYLDFLGREPDESGFNFWSNEIASCGNDGACQESKRVNVSAAYFLSIEFQRTGGLVDGLYRLGYGRAPKYAEFVPDTAAMSQNVVVGRGNWEEQLRANKRTFIDSFVNREAFKAAFDGLSNQAYVDSLIGNAGVSFDSRERTALLGKLDSGTATRAEVLLRIAENDGFVRAKRNATFVMMEYFGYLRRDPDEEGFQFWLRKLNQFDGNFERAEMVKAFINSTEYRARFRR